MIRLFRITIPSSVVWLLMAEILLSYGCYFAAYLLVGADDIEIHYLYEGGLVNSTLVVGSILMAAYFCDLYSELRVVSRLWLVQQFCLALGVAFLGQALASWLDQALILGHWQMIIGSGFAIVVLPAHRMLFDLFVLRVLGRQRVLYVGANEQVQQVAETVRTKPEFSMESVGYLSGEAVAEPPQGLGPHLGPLSELTAKFEELKPDLLVVGLTERRGQMPVKELLALRLRGVLVEDVNSLFERVMWRVPVESLRPSMLLFSGELGPSSRSLALQRAFSLAVAVVGSLLTLPLMAAVWVAVRLTSPGAAVYSQRRVGLNGKIFKVYKFRSMYIDAEARSGAVWAQKNDPRITPLGRWLRKLRLDELPQFFNVLKGDMAIVGPRPERPEFVDVLSQQIPFYGQRHAVLPGITGWAQINHKYGDTIEDTVTKLEFDLYYLKHLGLSMDLYIIFHTVKVMLMSKGSQ